MNPNYYEKQKRRANYRKMELIRELGGKCEICGYDKNYAALEFHHIDPEEKEFQLDARRIANTSKTRLFEELKKCKLVCANCHREIHHSDLDKNVVEEKSNFVEKGLYTLYRTRKEAICPICQKTFPFLKGKIFCSPECREKSKKYPSVEEVVAKYGELKSQQKVADFYNLTRKIIIGILKKAKT